MRLSTRLSIGHHSGEVAATSEPREARKQNLANRVDSHALESD